MPFVRENNVVDRHPVLPYRGDDLVTLHLQHAWVVRTLNDQERLVDVRRMKERRDSTQSFLVGFGIGEQLVDRGIPVITALQLERGRDGKYFLNSRWERRFNVDVWATGREITDEGLITSLQVMKNKQGGLVKWNKLEMVTDLDSWEVIEVRVPDDV